MKKVVSEVEATVLIPVRVKLKITTHENPGADTKRIICDWTTPTNYCLLNNLQYGEVIQSDIIEFVSINDVEFDHPDAVPFFENGLLVNTIIDAVVENDNAMSVTVHEVKIKDSEDIS